MKETRRACAELLVAWAVPQTPALCGDACSDLMHKTATEDSERRFLTSAPPQAGGDVESLSFATPAEIPSYDVDDLLNSLAVVTEAGVFRLALGASQPTPLDK